MTIIGLLIFVVVLVVAALAAYWVITKFFPAPAHMPLLAIVGVLLLLALIYMFFPEAATTKIWR